MLDSLQNFGINLKLKKESNVLSEIDTFEFCWLRGCFNTSFQECNNYTSCINLILNIMQILLVTSTIYVYINDKSFIF